MPNTVAQDRVVAIVLLAFVGAGYAATFGFSRVALYPRLLLALMALLAIVIFGRSFVAPPAIIGSDELVLTRARLVQPALLAIMVVAYALAIPQLGYFIATLIALPLFVLFMGVRNPVAPLLCGLGFIGFVYGLFRFQLGVPLPRGLLF